MQIDVALEAIEGPLRRYAVRTVETPVNESSTRIALLTRFSRTCARRTRQLAVLAVAASAGVALVACKAPPRLEGSGTDDRDEPSVAERRPDANGMAAATHDSAEREKTRLEAEHAKQVAAYLALPATATPAPAGSIFRIMTCPHEYGFVEDDAGDYCGKLCDDSALGLCEEAGTDGGARSCCGDHRCNRRMNNQVPWGRPDGPMPSVCSRDAKPNPPAKRMKP